jgi:hypothetical protein
MDLQGVKWGGGCMDSITLAQDGDRCLAPGTCECGNEPLGCIKSREFLD